ncbi:thiol-disulfide oxidoreductase DCC family protein [Salinicola sp. DM10]|uniref:thiol-disulfide oxidoreductase DCC family protein n=1 Tax=Salinicola sp. DM10 TaxID=2815721 RepID=UPI001A8FC75C|nr:DCC1-like thiol-disulfide oxidoreductase family protein [Salinicola sp. DM10]MCE3027778.1 DCC1-like thiol-disulfide oxidoreductase family protein [Salinicola sp. DM10]
MPRARPITAEAGASGIDGLLLFDADCPFCRRAVRWLLAHERDAGATLALSGLDSALGQCVGRHFGRELARCDTIRYVTGGELYEESEALWRLGRRLRGGWRLLAWLRWVPAPLRNAVYRGIGRYRRRLAPDNDARLEDDPRWRERLDAGLCTCLGLPTTLAEGAR